MSRAETVRFEDVKRRIIRIKKTDVILDNDVAELYGVETKRINEAVRNNPNKFPTWLYIRVRKGRVECIEVEIFDFNQRR